MDDIVRDMVKEAIEELYVVNITPYMSIRQEAGGVKSLWKDGLIGDMAYKMWEKYKKV